MSKVNPTVLLFGTHLDSVSYHVIKFEFPPLTFITESDTIERRHCLNSNTPVKKLFSLEKEF
jgi:hypothetical protein